MIGDEVPMLPPMNLASRGEGARQARMPGAERAGRALSVDEQAPMPAGDLVLFFLAGVVRHVDAPAGSLSDLLKSYRT
jgi:hypothetical protein